MALTATVLTDAYISINGTTVSDHGNKVELPVKVDEKKTTTFGQTYDTFVGGLKSASLKISFLNDFVAAQLDSFFWPLLGTVVTFEIRATSGSVTTSNPKYTGSILINSWTPISGSVGDLVQVDVDFLTSGTVTRGTS